MFELHVLSGYRLETLPKLDVLSIQEFDFDDLISVAIFAEVRGRNWTFSNAVHYQEIFAYDLPCEREPPGT